MAYRGWLPQIDCTGLYSGRAFIAGLTLMMGLCGLVWSAEVPPTVNAAAAAVRAC